MYNIVFRQEGDQRVARAIENNVSSFGDTYEEALESIQEAIALYEEDEDVIYNPVAKVSNLRFASISSSRYA